MMHCDLFTGCHAVASHGNQLASCMQPVSRSVRRTTCFSAFVAVGMPRVGSPGSEPLRMSRSLSGGYTDMSAASRSWVPMQVCHVGVNTNGCVDTSNSGCRCRKGSTF